MSQLPLKHYLLASDFDQTLSFNDSGLVLSELLGISGFGDRVAGLARSNLVQQGGELAYLVIATIVIGAGNYLSTVARR
jgi:hypothetical protein